MKKERRTNTGVDFYIEGNPFEEIPVFVDPEVKKIIYRVRTRGVEISVFFHHSETNQKVYCFSGELHSVH